MGIQQTRSYQKQFVQPYKDKQYWLIIELIDRMNFQQLVIPSSFLKLMITQLEENQQIHKILKQINESTYDSWLSKWEDKQKQRDQKTVKIIDPLVKNIYDWQDKHAKQNKQAYDYIISNLQEIGEKFIDDDYKQVRQKVQNIIPINLRNILLNLNQKLWSQYDQRLIKKDIILKEIKEIQRNEIKQQMDLEKYNNRQLILYLIKEYKAQIARNKFQMQKQKKIYLMQNLSKVGKYVMTGGQMQASYSTVHQFIDTLSQYIQNIQDKIFIKEIRLTNQQKFKDIDSNGQKNENRTQIYPQQNINLFKKQLNQQKNKYEQSKRMNRELEQRILDLQKIINQQRQTLIQKENILLNEKRNNRQLQQLFKKTVSESTKLLQQKDIQYKFISRQLQIKASQEYQNLSQIKNKQVKELSQKIMQLELKIKLFQTENNNINYLSIEKPPLLFTQPSSFLTCKNVQIIIQQLSKFGKILNTKRLYRYDARNKTNFLQYFSDRPCIFFAAKTSKKIVGGFTSCAFSTQISNSQKYNSFIFGLKDEIMKTYPLIEGKLPIISNSKQLIFGKSEIRIDTNKLILNSNFGLKGHCFDCGNDRVNNFLEEGENKREILLEDYQIYQIIYENGPIEKVTQKQVQVKIQQKQIESYPDQRYEIELQQKIVSLNQQAVNQIQRIRLLQKELKQKQNEINYFDQKIRNLQNLHNQQINLKKKSIQSLQSTIKQIENQSIINQTHTSTIIALKQQLSIFKSDQKDKLILKKIEDLQKKLKEKQNLEQIICKLQAQNRQLKKHDSESKQIKQQIRRLDMKVNEMEKQILIKQQKINLCNQQILTLNITVQHLKRQRQRLAQYESQCKSNLDYRRFFANELLADKKQYKKQIVDLLASRYGEIRQTKLLFRYDEYNKINFHKYLDKKPYILLIIKLENLKYIACFSESCFEKNCIGEYGFIMSLDKGQVFYVKKGFRAICYHDLQIIFGNSEISLKSGEKKIFSRFSTPNSCYESNQRNVDILLGHGKDIQEVPLSNYQFYQIVFEGK